MILTQGEALSNTYVEQFVEESIWFLDFERTIGYY